MERAQTCHLPVLQVRGPSIALPSLLTIQRCTHRSKTWAGLHYVLQALEKNSFSNISGGV